MKTNAEVCEVFSRGWDEVAKSGTMTATNKQIFSYETLLGERTTQGIILNFTRYSNTTSKQLHELFYQVMNYYGSIEVACDVPEGTSTSLKEYVKFRYIFSANEKKDNPSHIRKLLKSLEKVEKKEGVRN